MEWIGIAEVFDARIASGADEAVELGEHLALRLELLDDRLDHEIAVGQVGELGREGQPAERRVPLLGGRLAFLDGAANVVRDRLSGAFAELLADLAPDRLEPGLRGDLRDARTHRAQADDSHPTNHAVDAKGRTCVARASRSQMTRFLLVLLLLGLLVLAMAGACLTAIRGERPAILSRRPHAFA